MIKSKNVIKRLTKYVSAIIPLPFVFLFSSTGTIQTSNYKPTHDFSWLKTYGAIYYTFGADQWEKLSGRSFDSAGVHLTNNMYHPVNACHYALFCYDEYKFTKNERFKKAFLAQAKYLLDSTKYTKIDDDKIGYPYKYSWHDLKNPWYSALAQSEAISVLIRYYIMTGDEKAIPNIKYVKNFMINPQEDCGTLSYTPENNVWVEEYPNSKQERQVLNGFLLSIVALKEFSDLFPDDKLTKELYEKCLKSVKESMRFYDTGSWLKYNRGDGRLVANGYMKWLVNEAKHLHEVTNDIYFKKLYMLWATYGYNKEYVVPGCKVAYYNWGVPLEKLNGKFQPKQPELQFCPLSTLSVMDIFPAKKTATNVLFDNNNMTSFTFNKNDSVKTTPYIEIKTPGLVESKMIQIYVTGDTVVKGKMTFSYRLDTLEKWKEIKIQNLSFKKPNTYEFAFEKIKLNYLKVQFNLKDTNKIKLGELKINQSNLNAEDPEFYYYQTDTIRFGSAKPQLNCTFSNTDEFIVFYKSAANKDKLKTETWTVNNSTTSLPLKFDNNTLLYQFLIVLKRKNNSSGIVSIEAN